MRKLMGTVVMLFITLAVFGQNEQECKVYKNPSQQAIFSSEINNYFTQGIIKETSAKNDFVLVFKIRITCTGEVDKVLQGNKIADKELEEKVLALIQEMKWQPAQHNSADVGCIQSLVLKFDGENVKVKRY